MNQLPIEVVRIIAESCARLYPSESRRSVLTASRAFFEWTAPIVFAQVIINSQNIGRLVDLAERYDGARICARYVTTLVVPTQLTDVEFRLLSRARPPPLGIFYHINAFVGFVDALLPMVTNAGPFKLTRLYLQGPSSSDVGDVNRLLQVLNGPWTLTTWSITSVTRLRIAHEMNDVLAIVRALPNIVNITYDPVAVEHPTELVEGVQQLLQHCRTLRRLKIVLRLKAMIGADNERLPRQIALFDQLEFAVGRNDTRLFLVRAREESQDYTNWHSINLDEVWEPV